MTFRRRCGGTARRSKPQRPGAPAARRGASPATVRKAWSEAPRDRLGSKRWLSLPSRQGGRPETVRPPGALRSKPKKHRARDAMGTADLRLARLKLDRAKAGTDFDKPRCREASRPAGPSDPSASRAPSVLFGAAEREWKPAYPAPPRIGAAERCLVTPAPSRAASRPSVRRDRRGFSARAFASRRIRSR